MDRPHAHTPNDKGKWHYLHRHLKDVAGKACEAADKFGASSIAYFLGLVHDLGKVNPRFQSYLDACAKGRRHAKVPHAIGAAVLLYVWIFKAQNDREGWKELSLPILGHHAGLPDCGDAGSKLDQFQHENADLLNRMNAALKTLKLSSPSFALPARDLIRDPTRRELFIRMLFSALVDADYLDTERHFDPEQAELRGKGPSLETLWNRLEAEQNKITNASTLVNRIRNEVYENCLNASAGKPGLYRLTVPTGGGKTRSGLAFALKHALANEGFKGVIVAIPYTSIIDQTVQVYRNILGDDAVLEHHSALEITDDEEDDRDELLLRRKLATENWDARLIVTTTVQLFESLFSNRPSKVRKLHRLARAVIILDEVQTLPIGLLRPTLDALRVLATPVEQGGYGSTIVLCTATQPAYEDSRWLEGLRGMPITEIVPQYPEHFAKLKRVKYIRCRNPLSWEVLAAKVARLPQALVILNTRRDALALIAAMGDTSDVYHLSTLLCAAHRKNILDEVKGRLNPDNPQPVRLISTQVVEAGVDFDFPVVFRAIGPLDRLIQAGGRCNRENRLRRGIVVIFDPEEGKAPGGPYKAGLEKARLLLRENSAQRLHDPDLCRVYFKELFDAFREKGLDNKDIQSYREVLDYPEVAGRYRLIDKDTVPVVVRYGDGLARLAAWEATPGYKTWSGLQPYVVNLYEHEVREKYDWLDLRTKKVYAWVGSYDEKVGIMDGYNDPADLIVDR
ncbi:MAG: helicase Cas3 [Syntrophorhabdaceae bacterium PtaU1.Bin034]|nr:MAG: helicase Cas3 [Syntrophorhabdaceae bacterium PtaU1.Bin034]